MPPQVLIILVALGIIGFIVYKVVTKDETNTADVNHEAEQDRKIAELEKETKALRELLSDVIIGKIDDVRLKDALSRIFDQRK